VQLLLLLLVVVVGLLQNRMWFVFEGAAPLCKCVLWHAYNTAVEGLHIPRVQAAAAAAAVVSAVAETAAGAYVCWGYDNKEAPLRLCCPAGGPQGTNAEYKAFDGTTNPYIGLSAVVAAGILGELCAITHAVNTAVTTS
jgi:hypothetical protein